MRTALEFVTLGIFGQTEAIACHRSWTSRWPELHARTAPAANYVGVPGGGWRRWGEAVTAVVVPRDGHRLAPEGLILHWLRHSGAVHAPMTWVAGHGSKEGAMSAEVPPDPDGPTGIEPDVDVGVPAQPRKLAGHPLDVLGSIAAGGVIGAEARYGIGLALPHGTGGWPWATLLINISGCLLIGVLMVVITELVEPHRLVRPFLGVGILGGYTTFSTYTVDAISLADAARPGIATAYLLVTPVVAVLACALGAGATRLAARLPAAPRRETRR